MPLWWHIQLARWLRTVQNNQFCVFQQLLSKETIKLICKGCNLQDWRMIGKLKPVAQHAEKADVHVWIFNRSYLWLDAMHSTGCVFACKTLSRSITNLIASKFKKIWYEQGKLFIAIILLFLPLTEIVFRHRLGAPQPWHIESFEMPLHVVSGVWLTASPSSGVKSIPCFDFTAERKKKKVYFVILKHVWAPLLPEVQLMWDFGQDGSKYTSFHLYI